MVRPNVKHIVGVGFHREPGRKGVGEINAAIPEDTLSLGIDLVMPQHAEYDAAQVTRPSRLNCQTADGFEFFRWPFCC